MDTTDVASSDLVEPAGIARALTLQIAFSPEPLPCAAHSDLTGVTSLLIGRDVDTPALSLADGRVSRLHARLDFDARLGSMRLTDLKSRNGSFVNGVRVEQSLLTHGDAIRIGDSLLCYSEEDAMATVQARLTSFAATPLSVLLTGETGTGKEVFARKLHAESGRRGPFLAINCASLPRDLVAAELFGHTRAAFSGALTARPGVIAAAAGGTLLLDEIGDCPPDVQAALLRVLQERAVRPIGAEREQPVDVRFVAATHRPLSELVAQGAFRADLYARLAQISVHLPPLRERKPELLSLAKTFAGDAGFQATPDALEALFAWNWPFNLRELSSLVQAFVAARGAGATLDLEHLAGFHPELARPLCARARGQDPRSSEANRIPDQLSELRRLRALLTEHRGNVSEVARVLGKPRSQVYRWLKAAGAAPGRFRNG